mmetsp:Transcript_39440/g.121985  ORF Transcript_39440/g.121985 Transcript_39440/m.121985 type:complete len:217 (-) Transcript_39440:556-1206(-)
MLHAEEPPRVVRPDRQHGEVKVLAEHASDLLEEAVLVAGVAAVEEAPHDTPLVAGRAVRGADGRVDAVHVDFVDVATPEFEVAVPWPGAHRPVLHGHQGDQHGRQVVRLVARGADPPRLPPVQLDDLRSGGIIHPRGALLARRFPLEPGEPRFHTERHDEGRLERLAQRRDGGGVEVVVVVVRDGHDVDRREVGHLLDGRRHVPLRAGKLHRRAPS